jgi:hypothetical protein
MLRTLVVLSALAVSAPVLAAACVAQVVDAPDEVGTAEEPGLKQAGGPSSPLTEWLASHHGPCVTACGAALVGTCPTHDRCDDAVYDNIECAGVTLTCPAALNAATGNLYGMQVCVFSCEHPGDR